MRLKIIDSIIRWKIIIVAVGFLICLHPTKINGQVDSSLKVQYTFKNLSPGGNQVKDDYGRDTASFFNGAAVLQIADFYVLNLGDANGYLDLGESIGKVISTLGDFSISAYIYIDGKVNLNQDGNFFWTFANSNDVAANPNGQMFFSAKTTRYAISQTNWTAESFLNYAKEFSKGTWKHLTLTQTGSTGRIYIDGVLVKTGNINKQPKVLGATKYNYIGRSPYATDAYLKNSLIYDFRLYNRALSATEVSVLDDSIAALNDALIYYQLTNAKDDLVLNNLDAVISNLVLPTSASNAITISWISSNESVITNKGIVTRPAIGSDKVEVHLTATLSKEGKSITKEFIVTVLPIYSDKESISKDSAGLILSGSLSNLKSDIYLPSNGSEGSTITWISDKTDYLSNLGELIKLSAKGSGKVKVILMATLTKGIESANKNFEIYIAEDEGYAAYLFAYFTGNTGNQEAIRFALSSDGFNYRALNSNQPILNSANISLTGGVRDPHILRGVDGNTYYMVATDMVSAQGWESNHGIVLLKSNDLINWTSSTVDIKAKFPEFSTIDRAWAPQTIYDAAKGKYMVYFSLHKPNGKDIIYYSYANEDFTDLTTTPIQLYYDPNNSSTIDADIIFKDNKYYLFHKNETGGGIYVAISNNLTSGYVLNNVPVDQTTAPVEGSCTFKLINSDTYVLIYDMYTSGSYQFTTSTDFQNFTIASGVSMNFYPRHGTVMTITQAEADSLSKKWAKSADLVILSSKSEWVKKNNIVIDNAKGTVFLPVKNGTNLSSFSPELVSIPGAIITPGTPQDFSKDTIQYIVSIDGIGTKIYKVAASVNNNPLLDGYYADPEVLYSKKTGKYYIYPTSDGFTSWSGTYFKVFSSENLKDWQDEGVILDLPVDLSWASTNAWAPTIIEKMIDGNYKYFYYFCAAQKIGVAIADDPTGPFYDSGKPLISSAPAGASGQQIDPDVFYDSTSGKTYLYWGNGYMARAELNSDMISINTSTIKVITPDATYREGSEVFYRNGKYYFMWSENDTRSQDYRVRYATSDSPTGTLTIPKNNLVIAKDVTRRIYGTGHNCVLHDPKSGKWYIIYHRFTRPKGITMGDAAGYFREVCIDELRFDEDGNILQVKPTLEGFGSDVVSVGSILDDKNLVPEEMILYPNYPNPFNPVTNIKYALPEKSHVSMKIYDLLGRETITLVNEDKPAGTFITKFNGDFLSSGIYFCQLQAGKSISTIKLLLVK